MHSQKNNSPHSTSPTTRQKQPPKNYADSSTTHPASYNNSNKHTTSKHKKHSHPDKHTSSYKHSANPNPPKKHQNTPNTTPTPHTSGVSSYLCTP